METGQREITSPGDEIDAISTNGEETSLSEALERWRASSRDILDYVNSNRTLKNTNLFSFLALLNNYVPVYLFLQSECARFLGPPNPIDGGPSFEQRMEPFNRLIKTFVPSTGQGQHVCMIHPEIAKRCVQLLADKAGITRSSIAKAFMTTFGNQVQPEILQCIKTLLTTREMGRKRKNRFSRLIEDITEKENFHQSVSVLELASVKLRSDPILPQTLSRLYYYSGDYGKAEGWAEKAIKRAPLNSYVADTLGQIHKNQLWREAWDEQSVLTAGEKALKAFKKVEKKADEEERLEMQDPDVLSISKSFNNRGKFGYMQVSKIIFDKLTAQGRVQNNCLIGNLRHGVKERFDFFEWYLTYSRLDVENVEPSYFWSDIVCCYQQYHTTQASQSTSFPGLLDCLHHGLVSSKGHHAGISEVEKTDSDIEEIRNDLRTIYDTNVSDVKEAEKYILSNIILANKRQSPHDIALQEELKMIMHRFLNEKVGKRSPEFYLLGLLLFWPKRQQENEDEEEENSRQTAAYNGSNEEHTLVAEDSEEDNEEQDHMRRAGELPGPDWMHFDLNKNIEFMRKNFEKRYDKYLRNRYLIPLFFLGKGNALSRWVHKSKLDKILEEEAKLPNTNGSIEEDEQHQNMRSEEEIRDEVNKMWSSGQVWRVQGIQDILLPVNGETEQHVGEELFACIGETRVKVEVDDQDLDALSQSQRFVFYLGFTIRGPVAFNVRSAGGQ